MAKRRMFSMDIIDTDTFLEMPATAQLLYFHLSMRADDDGFVSAPKRILRLTGASEGDLKTLFDKDFVIPFRTGICVIKHWKIHNYIQKDRYHATIYQEEKRMLKEEKNGVYKMDPRWIHNGYKMDTQVSLGEVSLGESRKEEDCPELSPENSEPPPSVSKTSGTPFIQLPTIGSVSCPEKTYTVTEEEILEYQEVYPNVDVRAELRKMKLWIDANPTKRKKNVKAFIARWLAKAQDRPKPPRKLTYEEILAEEKARLGEE